ncbi:hypothetical protein [Aquidulcibacter sp.]|uniref:hypothetical protein n=1 Tax=Aquidulcibacter sp. TaxID=2052990 RepID=UPI0025BDB22D|nr:hypothetical protein [Aquidulcibacter sp.]MCA3692359.1 hypothetical protein [Aquidulcibacter sp.]
MGLEQICRDWRWAKRALALCALAFTVGCTLLVGPYPSSRDWPFGADVSEVTLELQPDDWLPAPPQTIKIVRTKNGAEFYASSPNEDSFGGALAIKYLGSNPRGDVYGYAIPKSDLPDDIKGRKTKSELRMAQREAASAFFGSVIIARSPDGARAMSLTFGGPFCPENTVEACTYDTSAAVWALLAAKVPEMTFEDVPIYTIRY